MSQGFHEIKSLYPPPEKGRREIITMLRYEYMAVTTPAAAVSARSIKQTRNNTSPNKHAPLPTQKDIQDRPWSVFGNKRLREKKNGYTHVSLFSGCGGLDLGFRAAGFRTVWANDIDPDACETFRENLGPIEEGDIRTITFPKLGDRVDVLSAGFPCQPFSNAGSRRGVKDSRGDLYNYALDAVKAFKPKVVLFENVRGLLSVKVARKLLIEKILSKLHALGYDCQLKLVDASNHRVAQRRMRLLIVGVHRNTDLGSFRYPQQKHKTGLTIGDTILDISSVIPNQNERMQLNPQAIMLGSLVPEGGSWKDIPYESLPERLQYISDNMAKYRWPKFYARFHRNDIAGTITAAFKPENAGVWHPIESRVFSVREIARIQSFPDWFVFGGRSVKSKYQQIGNAVPPRLAYEVAIEIINVLEGHSPTTLEDFLKKGEPLRPSDKAIHYKP
jgi:DNA (cytosine-5)-methyltransferase 1